MADEPDHPPFNGVLVVDDETFERIAADLQKPGKPSAASLRGAEFLRRHREATEAAKNRKPN